MALTSAQLTIANLAMGYLGEYVATSTLTDEKQYLYAERYYDLALEEVLVDHPWNEAMTSVVIAEDADDPIFGYDKRFAVPSDALRIISVNDDLGADVRNSASNVDAWETEGDYILANAGVSPQTWATATDYVDGEFFTSDSVTYEVLVSHTSDTIANDLASNNIVSAGGDYKVIYVRYVKNLTDTTKWSPRLKHAVAMKLAIKLITGLTNDTKGKDLLINEFERITMPKARSVDSMQGKPRPIFNSEWIRSRIY